MRCPLLAALTTVLITIPAYGALPDGAKAPDFSTAASLAGKEFKFSLADALKKGPVVLYFYPAAFTPGCTVEAHEFAEATAKFQQLGATVIGVSHDPIEKLDRFSVSECRNKFAVASDADGGIMKAYDSVLPSHPEYANRTSYVIARREEVAGRAQEDLRLRRGLRAGLAADGAAASCALPTVPVRATPAGSPPRPPPGARSARRRDTTGGCH